MKFLSSLALFAAIFTTSTNLVDAHSSIKNPLPRGHPLNPNAAVKDYACITTPLNGGPGCAPKAFPCGGYPQDTQITQVLTAGEIITVNFWNPNFPNGPQPGDETRDQARHNGGQCEFSLSYDGGVTYTVIGTYHETCPDIFFDWKVKIPENAPSCDKPGKCLFSWSWINAVGNREFYQNCADVKIVGNSTTPLPIKDITRANLPPQFPTILTPTGDPSNNGNLKGSGPLASDVSANLQNTIGAGNGNDGSTTTSAPTSASTSASTTASATTSTSTSTSDSTSAPKPPKGGKGGKKSGNNGSSSGDNNGSSSGDNSGSSSSCTTDGQMTCVKSGSSATFNTCVNGSIVARQCPSGTVCNTVGNSIQCT